MKNYSTDVCKYSFVVVPVELGVFLLQEMPILGNIPGQDAQGYDVGLRDEKEQDGGSHQVLPVPGKEPGQVVEEVGGEEVAVPGGRHLRVQVVLAEQGQ